MLVLLLTVGCTPDPVPDSGVPVPWDPPPMEVAEGWANADDWMFNLQVVHHVDIELSDQAIASIWDDPFTYVQGDATFDGEPIPDVGVRLKGRIGSFQNLSSKSGFKLDVNRFVDGRDFHGHEMLTLNNAIVDCSYTKEHLGYSIYRQMGIEAPRTGFAWVTLNGEPYGLYVLVETEDDSFLKRRFEEPDGSLYDGKYLYYPDGSYTLMDFTPSLAPYYEQEEGADIGHADIIAFADQLAASTGTPDFYQDMAPWVNWERQHMHVAIDQYIGHVDGYSMNTNNYRAYFDPGDDGRLTILPWDLDYAFIPPSYWGKSWARPQGVLTAACFSDAACVEGQRAAVELLLDTVDDRALRDLIDQVEDLAEDYIADDPRRRCSSSESRSWRNNLADWVRTRDRELRETWEL